MPVASARAGRAVALGGGTVRRRRRTCRLARADRQRRGHGWLAVALLADLDVDDDHGDVVGATVLVGHLDQPVGRLLGVVHRLEDLRHFVRAHLVGQAVGAEQEPVPGAQLQLPHVGLHLGGDPEGAGQDVPLGVDGGLRLGHLAVAHPLLGQAVVVGHLDHLPLGEHVRPRVADVGQRQHVVAVGTADQRHRGQGGAHAPQVQVRLALLPNGGVRLGEGVTQSVGGRLALEGLLERLDRHTCRHLAADVAAHAVGHGVEVGPLERHVLVDGAHPPDVGGRAGPQHGHRDTSNTVEPIWSRSPLPRRTAWEICSELT